MVLFVQAVVAQHQLVYVLTQVEKNNKSIQTNKHYWASKQAELKTGLTPYDPVVEYDYLYGSPVGAGNQRDLVITQRFDFPTVYKRKRELSDRQIAQTVFQQQVFRQDILLEAKLLTLKVIYLNKKEAELARRLQSTQKVLSDYEKKFEKGDATILDFNKAKLQLLNIENDVRLAQNEKQVVLTKVTELNGGEQLLIADTLYPLQPIIPDFEMLDSIIEAHDPILKIYEQEKKVWAQQMNVQKSMNLPKIETGYHSQGILGQSYRGIRLGITIPLWENKGKLQAVKSGLQHAESAAVSNVLEHRFENKQWYDQLAIRGKILEDSKALLTSLNNTVLLDKALALGQITVIQYFYEASFYYASRDRYLQAEWEYQELLAKLYRFEL
ncbi:MAG TPA: transporter [Chitinophagaceae bacterium]|nr:transporter [Chitinophagaceae bacterium]